MDSEEKMDSEEVSWDLDSGYRYIYICSLKNSSILMLREGPWMPTPAIEKHHTIFI